MTETTERRDVDLRPTPGRQLRVMGPRGVETHLLPDMGSLVLGRDEAADVVLDDASVSRRHARLTLGASIGLEDLGSANGTRVGEEALSPKAVVELRVGEVFEIGDLVCAVQGRPHEPVARVASGEDAVILAEPSMLRLDAELARFAAGMISVLLLGEAGVGKEVFARRVHSRSPRRSGPFVAFNCAALPEHLVESELFGHEKGAFTGATSARVGLLESARGGTVFLDEVGELSPSAQPRLLRALQERRVRPVGATAERAIDVRFVAATNRDIEREVREGRFREDLYYRLRGVVVRVPPLRERPSEIEPLARRFVAELWAEPLRRIPPALSPDALDALRAHTWPGNVRELRSEIERAVLLCDGPLIRPEHLTFGRSAPAPSPSPSPPGLTEGESAERRRIVDALAACVQNQTRAATRLGMTRKMLVDRIRKYGLPGPLKVRRPR